MFSKKGYCANRAQSLWAVTCASERHLDFEQRGKCLADFELLVVWEDAIEEAFEC